ncbi:TIGR02530 family flagellar biosynthesis protein [Fusibacter sp. JL216-2]|uniref:TIGR02530 family flagellar biosynthesis protein n=1 Tax=Fusibacter sp. JL216-2 TaxID=3071453 RepID=UPI003D344225
MNNDYVLRKAKITGTGQVSQNIQNQNNVKPQKSFNEILDKIQNNDQVKFSKHAIQRLESRNIKLEDSDIEKLNNAVNKAESKGVKDALIIMGDKAFVASIKNRTIITAAAEDQLKENVFTKIDGAVII